MKRNKFFITLIVIIFFLQCNVTDDELVKISGEAQGTTYHITYSTPDNEDISSGIDSVLRMVDSSVSTYVSHSIISRVNRNEAGATPDKIFAAIFQESKEVSERTNGKFDVTVAPLINGWGFGFTKKEEMDSSRVDSLLQFVGYKTVSLINGSIIKENPKSMLDFNALAQGYTVDLIADLLDKKGIQNYLVELGGEVKAKGRKNKNEFWTIGIDQPHESQEEGRPLKAKVRLLDKALATSGNYRKFYVQNGNKYAHIIDPFTGFPVKHNLLSATVIAGNCMTADAYATAFMVMGMKNSIDFLSGNKDLGLEVFFIYDEGGKWKTYSSTTLKNWIEEVP